VNEKAIVPKIAQGERQQMAIERVPDIGKRLFPPGGIERAVVNRPNQVRKGLTRDCIGHDHRKVKKLKLAGFCIIIIKRPRHLAEKSRMILWLKVDCTCARPTMLLANAQVSPNIACAVATKGWATINTLQFPSIGALDQYFDHTRRGRGA
jgi:hypothetical protein